MSTYLNHWHLALRLKLLDVLGLLVISSKQINLPKVNLDSLKESEGVDRANRLTEQVTVQDDLIFHLSVSLFC